MPTLPAANFLDTHPLLLTLGDLAVFVLKAAVVLVLTVILSRFATRRLRRGLEAAGYQITVIILLNRILWASMWAVAILLVVVFLGTGFTPLAAFIGVVGLAASLSLQQLLQNLVAGIYLLAERPFEIGDIVSVVGPSGINHEGRVEDIQMRTTHLRGRDDELILVPNSAMFAGVVTNRTAVGGYATEITVTFPRDKDPDFVRGQVAPLLQGLTSVLPSPEPALRVDKAGKDEWTASVLFWAIRQEARSDAVWALAHAFPDATVSNGSTTA